MALELLDITHRYGPQTALDAVSLHVHDGDCYGFLGHNGAGKTTAMRIALGLTRPSAGRVLVDGFDALAHPVEARARVGGLIETPGFHGHLSGERNLILLARLAGMGRSDARLEASRALDVVGLADAAKKPAGAYSQGMRQRLGIAQALLGRPPYVLLDEPTNGLDPEGIEEIRRVLWTLTRDEGTTVLLSSHQLHELAGLCNRVAILRHGRVLVEQETASLLNGGRVALHAAELDIAERLLRANGVEYHRDGSEILIEDAVDEEQMLADLVAAGARPTQFGSRPETLEDVYLRLTREAPPRDAGTPSDRHVDSPERRAPALAIGRVAAYDLRRWASSLSVPALLATPAAIAAGAVALRAAEAARFAAEVAEGGLATTTEVTAFEGVATGLGSGLPVLALVVAGLASQSLAGEMARGTLRNVLLRPLRRRDAVLGKALAAVVAASLSFAALLGATFAAAAWAFDFTDLAEVLFNGERFPLPGATAAEVWPCLVEALWRPLPAVGALVLVGGFAGSLTRGAASALAVALGLVVGPDILRTVLRSFELEHVVPAAHLPSPFGDTSFVAHFLDVSQGVSNTGFEAGTAAWATPLAWGAAALVLSVLVLSRRSIR